MYANQMAAYKEMHNESLSGRELEASVLTKAAALLKNCQDTWGGPDHEHKLSEALKYNQRLWSVFQAELANPENPLPKELRQNLLSLSIFIDKRTFEVIAYPVREKLTILININMNLAAGLSGKPE